MPIHFRAALPILVFLLCEMSWLAASYGEPYVHNLAPASDEAQKQIAAFRVPDGFQVEVAAAEPELANPVAFCFDERGRILVCETYRAKNAVLDNRNQMNWLDEDLAARTVEDRAAYIRKHFPDYAKRFTQHHDRLRLLDDRDGDGRYEVASVFADGFNDLLDGIGAGVLAHRGDVFFTCIPNLWKLRDTKGTGQADERVALHRGYGVRWAFYGHDMHGLCIGPDGKLYYSIGDRGFNVTADGKALAMPDRGAVFRCNLDGSELELVASGLRNPQELAFDQYGNLFTGDNNSDSGDKARWVFVVEGGDSGWRMHYQYPGDRGPWNREKLWDPQFPGQAAYIIPPIAHLPSGPSGLAYNPGVGLPEEMAGQFLLVDFHGSPVGSGVNTIAMKPKGASFEVAEIKPFVQNLLATDVAFGPDSAVYVSDWVQGWEGQGKGRIYRVLRPSIKDDPQRVETQALLLTDLRGKPADELAGLLGHADIRVRLNAQFALADTGAPAIDEFQRTLRESKVQLARIHAIWGLGQVGRKLPEALPPVVEVLTDADAEIRAQAAKVLGDCRYAAAGGKLIQAISDDAPRVRYLAAQSLGKLATAESVTPLVDLLRANNDEDVVVRHAAALALSRCTSAATLAGLANDSSAAVRLGIVLALRHQQSPELARFLADNDPRMALEAARAIHDLLIAEAMPAVAAMSDRPYAGDELQRDALWRRVLNANFRAGAAEHAKAVGLFATRLDVSDALKREALQILADWAKPNDRDRVVGEWRPLEPRDGAIASAAVRELLPQFLASKGVVRQLAMQLAARVGIREVAPMLAESVKDQTRPAGESADALLALESLRHGSLKPALDAALEDARPDVRAAALSVVVRTRPADALPALEKALAEGTVAEKKVALTALGAMPAGKADELLCGAFSQLAAGQLPPELQLELLTSSTGRKDLLVEEALARFEATRKADDPLAPYRETLAGGNAENGRQLFFQKAEVYCVRCHRVQGVGGDVGPDLSKIGADKPRDYLLQSMVDPNAAVAKGFESVTLALDDGRVISGVFREENDVHLRLVSPEGQSITIAKDTIEDRATGKSAMPEDLVKKISKSELRDLVEYLATLKQATGGHQ